MEHYGQKTPPEIDISQIRVPVAMMVGDQDTLATYKDSLDVKSKIKSKSLYFYDHYPGDHISLIVGKDN